MIAQQRNPDFNLTKMVDTVKSSITLHTMLAMQGDLTLAERLALRSNFEVIEDAITGIRDERWKDSAMGHLKASLYNLSGDESLLNDR